MKRLLRHPAAQALLAWLLGLYLSFALRSTRWEVEGMDHLTQTLRRAPAVAAFWHERLPLMPMLWLKARRETDLPLGRVQVLVSHHRDGRFIGTVIRRFGIDVTLGSSSRGGASGLRRLLASLGRGEIVAITPDGPRGPAREAAPGVAHLAALSGLPVLPCAAQISRRWVLRSWDRMIIPLPFGRGVLVCGPAITVPRAGWKDAVPAIGAALTEAANRADQLCPA
jgi:lysophospholipid acyltransferase (LPLAT)-like uncharacterized protein